MADACRAMSRSVKIVAEGLALAELWALVRTPWKLRVALMAALLMGRVTAVPGWPGCNKEIKHTLNYDVILSGETLFK